jgi:hypothetical protein
MYRVGPMQGKTFVPMVGFLTAVEAQRAVNGLNNFVPYVPPAPLRAANIDVISTQDHVRPVRPKFKLKGVR